MRSIFVAVIAVALVAASFFTVAADEGKNIFASKCGSCHRAGGEAQAIAPSKYAGVQWQRFFEKDRHAAKKDIKTLLSPADLAAVQNYLMAHAADSDKPETLGSK